MREARTVFMCEIVAVGARLAMLDLYYFGLRFAMGCEEAFDDDPPISRSQFLIVVTDR